MTRYARAKGSKASNERIPNEATPWHVMKQQLIENLSKKQEFSEKTKSVKELLEHKQNKFITNDIESVNNSWAEFPDNSKREKDLITNKIKKKQKIELNKAKIENDTKINKLNISVDTLNKKRKKNVQDISEIEKNKNDVIINTNESQNEKVISFKRQKYNKEKSLNENLFNIAENNNDNFALKNTNNNKNINVKINQTIRINKNPITKSQKYKDIPNKFGMKKFDNQKKKKKLPKIRDDKEHKRRKPDLGSSKIIINGVEIEIVKFNGFPIKKEDADRLNDLKQKMIMKGRLYILYYILYYLYYYIIYLKHFYILYIFLGIPQKEIDAAMKLERRKAEKALARIKKCVCFHCRKAGHNLSDCPELGSEQAGTGICYKCGSTEHTHFECKVTKPTEYRYATCFICREQGHIAKQCPDNPKGIYPQGGACKICGDVTHLKKDCPDLIKEKEENIITVKTITNDNIESLEEKNVIDKKDDKKTKKVVKF